MSAESDCSESRRDRLTYVCMGGTAMPLWWVDPAEVADLPHLDADKACARALGYVEDAAKVDAKVELAYRDGRRCGSCRLFRAAGARDGYASCALLPGEAVSQSGWCRNWAGRS